MLRTLFLVFLKIGAFTFGGGYAMIALLENEFVEKRDWLEQKEFMDMVAIAESTPGPVAVNSATYIGYKMAGTAGAAVATLGVCLPSFGIIYLISLFFDQFLSLRLVGCAFRGIQVCVIYLILSAGLKLWWGLEKTPLNLVLLGGVFAAMLAGSVLAVSFSSVFYILLGGVIGLMIYGAACLKKKGAEQK